jgi:hypothetical protein
MIITISSIINNIVSIIIIIIIIIIIEIKKNHELDLKDKIKNHKIFDKKVK